MRLLSCLSQRKAVLLEFGFGPSRAFKKNDGFSRSERTDQWVRCVGDTRLFLGNGQAGEDLEVRLAGQEGLPLVL